MAAREEFTIFVERRQTQLLRLTRALTGDEQLGEDLAQATLDRLWARWRRVSAGGDPWAYTQRIAVSMSSTWRRRKWRYEMPTAQLPETAYAPDGESAELTRQLVARWLAALPRRQRAVIVLRFLADVSVDEAANVLGCSPGTVKSQTASALRHLRTLAELDKTSEERTS